MSTVALALLLVSSQPAASSPSSIPQAALGEERAEPVLVRARGPAGETVRWSPSTGLVLERGDQGVSLRGCAFPRFSPDGKLWLERSVDDGHHVECHELLVVEPGAAAPRLARSGEVEPPRDLRATETPSVAGALPRICVDPGHGGGDPGALGFGLEEADIVLDIALRFAAFLEADTADPGGGGAWEVLLTRDDDSTVSLFERVDLANAWPADRFVSIHANAFTSSAANGTETFSFAEGTTSALMRDAIHAEMLDAWGLTDRGTKTAGFYVLVNTTMPASLSETGFVTSPIDVVKLADPVEREAMALAHLFALQSHFGIPPYEPSGSGGAAGTLKGIVYDASVGTSAPIPDALIALADGTFTQANGSGYFEFPLAAGAYDFAAGAPGFASRAAQETVTSGDAWESVGLDPFAGPTLSVPASLAPGEPSALTVAADPSSFVWLAVSDAPSLPLVDLGALGVLWGGLGAATVPLGIVPGSGVLAVPFFAPEAVGATFHLQALSSAGGALALSNPAALTLL